MLKVTPTGRFLALLAPLAVMFFLPPRSYSFGGGFFFFSWLGGLGWGGGFCPQSPKHQRCALDSPPPTSLIALKPLSPLPVSPVSFLDPLILTEEREKIPFLL